MKKLKETVSGILNGVSFEPILHSSLVWKSQYAISKDLKFLAANLQNGCKKWVQLFEYLSCASLALVWGYHKEEKGQNCLPSGGFHSSEVDGLDGSREHTNTWLRLHLIVVLCSS